MHGIKTNQMCFKIIRCVELKTPHNLNHDFFGQRSNWRSTRCCFVASGPSLAWSLALRSFHTTLNFQEDSQARLRPAGGWSGLICRGEKTRLCFYLVQLRLRPFSLEQVEKNEAQRHALQSFPFFREKKRLTFDAIPDFGAWQAVVLVFVGLVGPARKVYPSSSTGSRLAESSALSPAVASTSAPSPFSLSCSGELGEMTEEYAFHQCPGWTRRYQHQPQLSWWQSMPPRVSQAQSVLNLKFSSSKSFSKSLTSLQKYPSYMHRLLLATDEDDQWHQHRGLLQFFFQYQKIF